MKNTAHRSPGLTGRSTRTPRHRITLRLCQAGAPVNFCVRPPLCTFVAMAKIESTLINEAKLLASQAADILSKAQADKRGMEGEELAKVSSWVTRLGQTVRKLYGEQSEQYATYSKAVETQNFYSLHSNWNKHIAILLGLAQSILHDLEQGLIFEVRALLQAEVFSDFLEMGEYLLKEGYKDAAAVIVGAVLEDSLRNIAKKANIQTNAPNGRPLTIEPLNTALAGANIYSKLVQKQITSWAHVRNKAAHGEYGEYTKEHVEMMILFTQSFCSEHLQ
jgi:uncharacterized protein (DUF2164 family)